MSQMPTLSYLRSALRLWRLRPGRGRRAPVAFVIWRELETFGAFCSIWLFFEKGVIGLATGKMPKAFCAPQIMWQRVSMACGQMYFASRGAVSNKQNIVLRLIWSRRFDDGCRLTVSQGFYRLMGKACSGCRGFFGGRQNGWEFCSCCCKGSIERHLLSQAVKLFEGSVSYIKISDPQRPNNWILQSSIWVRAMCTAPVALAEWPVNSRSPVGPTNLSLSFWAIASKVPAQPDLVVWLPVSVLKRNVCLLVLAHLICSTMRW